MYYNQYRMVNYLRFFGLNEDYTKEELKSAYVKKVKEIDTLNISDIDKQFYIEQSYKLYKNAKYDLYNHDNFFLYKPMSLFNDFFNNMRLLSSKELNDAYSYSEYKSYSEKINEDKTKTIVETIKTIKNGVETVTTNTYKKYPDGKVEPVTKQITQ